MQAACDTLTNLTIAGGPVAVGPSAERQLELATSCADLWASLSGSIAGSGQAWVWTAVALLRRPGPGPARGRDEPPTSAGTTGRSSPTSTSPPRPATGWPPGCLTDDDVRDGTADDLRSALAEDPSQFEVVVRTADGAIRGPLG